LNEASARTRVALFRAADDARKSAERLATMGFEAVIAPVMAPVGLEPPVPTGRFDAVAATSAKALDLMAPSLLASLAQTALYVVGAAGVAAAARRGLGVAGSAGDARDLARVVIDALGDKGRVLYLAGADRKPDMENALIRAGFSIEVAEVYAARALSDWSAEEAHGVASCRAALHFSRRSAELALGLALRAGIEAPWRAMTHVTISVDAAEPFHASGVAVVIAAAPREEAMFTALDIRSQQDATKGRGSLPLRALV
jgi:uroporphyrinogen-III synthase